MAKHIAALPAVNKPAVFKRRKEDELFRYLERANRALIAEVKRQTKLPGLPKFTTSDNNRDGKDLHDEVSGLDVELKSGPDRTDANIGLATLAWSLGDRDRAELVSVLNGGRQARIGQAIEAYQPKRGYRFPPPNSTECSKLATMRQFVEYTRMRLNPGAAAPEKLAHFVRCVSLGITKGPEIEACHADPANAVRPLLLECEWGEGLKPYGRSFLPEERLVVDEVRQTPLRALIVVTGKNSGTHARICPHFRNSYRPPRLPNKIPASYWVCSPSFNVWIRSSGEDGDQVG